MHADTVIVSFFLILAFSPIFWLVALGPAFFTIALTKLRVRAHILKRHNRVADLPEIVQILGKMDQGDSEYSIMEFSIHFYTLLASLFGINIAFWKMVHFRLVMIPSEQVSDWVVLRPYTLLIQGGILSIVSIGLLLSGFFGTPKVIETYGINRQPFVADLTLPPFNRILVARIICGISALYISYLTFYGLKVRILP